MAIYYNPAAPHPGPTHQNRARRPTPIFSGRPNYYDSADWWQLRAAIMKALFDFPEARDSVIRALRELHALQEPDAPTS